MNLRSLFGLPARELPGAAPNTVDPAAHLGVQAPHVMGEVEWTGADYDTMAVRQHPPRATRNWRMTSAADSAANNDIALTDSITHDTVPSRGRGEPDLRRVEADQAAGPVAEFRPFDEHLVNFRGDVTREPEAPPERARQGFTGADPTRTARHQIAFTIRPFDQGIAQHPSATPKAGQPNPLASRPPTRSRLIGGRPSAAGSAGTGMEPVGSPQPNTVRQAPPAWDARLVNPGIQAAGDARSRGWRGR